MEWNICGLWTLNYGLKLSVANGTTMSPISRAPDHLAEIIIDARTCIRARVQIFHNYAIGNHADKPARELSIDTCTIYSLVDKYYPFLSESKALYQKDVMMEILTG